MLNKLNNRIGVVSFLLGKIYPFSVYEFLILAKMQISQIRISELYPFRFNLLSDKRSLHFSVR